MRFKLLLRHASLWALNLAGVNFSDDQQHKLARTLRHTRVSHLALPLCSEEHQEALLGAVAGNIGKHSLWRLGGDPTQNQVVLHVQGLWADPADHPENAAWLRENISPSRVSRLRRKQSKPQS